jgi:ribosomal protein L6P/L9E
MSRLGKLPIKLPDGVSIVASDTGAIVKSPKGEVKVLINNIIDENTKTTEGIIAFLKLLLVFLISPVKKLCQK